MKKIISFLQGNMTWNYFYLFLKENSQDEKTEVDQHIFIDLGTC